jgi:hypothetical protein
LVHFKKDIALCLVEKKEKDTKLQHTNARSDYARTVIRRKTGKS